MNNMLTYLDLIKKLKSIKPDLMGRYPLHRIALFGSWIHGKQNSKSDVDILVEVDGSIGLRFVDLADELEAILDRKVDLVSRRAIKPSLWKEIESELVDV